MSLNWPKWWMVSTIWMLFLNSSISAMCPNGCECNSANLHAVKCESVALSDFPVLLDPRTRTLSLIDCGLQQLDVDALDLYPDLEYLDLSHNNLTTIDGSLFAHLSKLRVLRLRGNHLTRISRGTFTGLSSLEVLDISNNKVEVVEPSSMFELSRLRELDLSKNSLIRLIPGAFSGLSHLLQLDLSRNRLARIAPEPFSSIANVRQINLSTNLISTFYPNVFLRQGHLERLDLSSNLIVSLPNAFQGLVRLKFLNVSNNMLQRMEPSSVRPLGALRILDLSWNQFTELTTSAFEGLSALQHLILDHQQNLRSIQMNAFSGLSSLQFLDLSYCQRLEHIDSNAFEYIDSLRSLDLSNCNIQRLPPNLLDWTKLKLFSFGGNPLNCERDQIELISALLRSHNLFDVRCASPPRFAGKTVDSLPQSTLTETEVSVIVVASLLVVLSTLIVVFLCMRQRIACVSSKDSHSRTPYYARSPLIGSLASGDKGDLLTDNTFYTSSRPTITSTRSPASIFSENEYYSSIMLPPAPLPPTSPNVHTTFDPSTNSTRNTTFDTTVRRADTFDNTFQEALMSGGSDTFDETAYRSDTFDNSLSVQSAVPGYPQVVSIYPKPPFNDGFKIISQYPVPITEL